MRLKMTEAEIRAALQKRGWTYHPRKRRERIFAYASHRNGKNVDERYLAALDAPNLEKRMKQLPNVAQQQTQQVYHQTPRCSTVYSRTKYSHDGTFWHTPNTSEPGGYDVQGNYWCADCKDRIALMNQASSLGYPEVSYFPQNPEGMRATMIFPGKEEWQRRLPQIWNPDRVREKVNLLLSRQAANVAQPLPNTMKEAQSS
jgi:hypothetical protein